MNLKLAEIMESEPHYERILEYFVRWKPCHLDAQHYAEMLQAFAEGWQVEREKHRREIAFPYIYEHDPSAILSPRP